MRAAPDSWDCLVLWFTQMLGLEWAFFCGLGLPPACVCADEHLGTNMTPNCGSHGGIRAGGVCVGCACAFCEQGPPSHGSHCHRDGKAGCLACGEEEKTQKEEALMQDITLPQRVSAGDPLLHLHHPLCLLMPGVKLSSSVIGGDLHLLHGLVPLAVPSWPESPPFILPGSVGKRSFLGGTGSSMVSHH